MALGIGLLLTAILFFDRWRERRGAARRQADDSYALLETKDNSTQQYDLFISYDRGDHLVGDIVADKVRLAGSTVFLDRLGHMAGSPFASALLQAVTQSRVFTPLITLAALRQLAAASPTKTNWLLFEYILALHFWLSNRSLSIYPLAVGPETQALGDVCWASLWELDEYKLLRSSLPDTVPLATLETVVAALGALDPPQTLCPALAALTVRDLMTLPVGRCAAHPQLCGILYFEAASIVGRRRDAGALIGVFLSALRGRLDGTSLLGREGGNGAEERERCCTTRSRSSV
jgi:hypothetical protein